jgi:Bacterial PH domain/Short C-terminal domain
VFVSVADEQTGVRLQDGEEVLLALRITGWGATQLKILTLGLYIPWWRATWFVVTDRRLVSKKGILNKTEISLPLHFVQDASVHTSWQGIGRVELSTAGGGGGISRIIGLKAQDARQLADTIMSQARHINVDIDSSQRGTGDVSKALARLANLRDTGVLTEDEFAQQKARLLQSGS